MKIMLKRNKKGSDEWLEQIPYILLTIVVMAGIFLLVSMYINLSIDVKSLQREVFFNRIIYSPQSITYIDNITGIVYPGVIDLARFNNDTLDSLIKYSYERQLSAKLYLYDQQKNLVKTAYLNGVWFNRLEPLARNKITGFSSATIEEKNLPVTYRTNGVLLPGYLKVEILMPN